MRTNQGQGNMKTTTTAIEVSERGGQGKDFSGVTFHCTTQQVTSNTLLVGPTD